MKHFPVWLRWVWWRRLRGRLATAQLARAVVAMDPDRVRVCLRHAHHPNPQLKLPRNMRIPGLSERPRALDFVLASSRRRRLHRHQHPVLVIARLLLENGARLSPRGAPAGSLSLIQLRNMELLAAACLNQKLWEMAFTWFAVVDGRPQPMRLTYERFCDQEGWTDGAEYLRQQRNRAIAEEQCDILEGATPPATGHSRLPGRL